MQPMRSPICRNAWPASSKPKSHAENLQKNRYGSDILRLVDKAFAEAQNIKSAGFDLAEARAEMARLHSNITKS